MPSLVEERTAPAAAGALIDKIVAFWEGRAIWAATELYIPDMLAVVPMTSQEVAEIGNLHAPSVDRLLRALSVSGVLQRREDSRYELTEAGKALCLGTPGSIRHLISSELGHDHYGAWESILGTLKTGDTAFEAKYGMPVWQYYGVNLEASQRFNRSMKEASLAFIPAILRSYDFSDYSTIADIGGGTGAFLSAVLERARRTRGILFEQPDVIADAEPCLTQNGLSNRARLVAGDFRKEVPVMADLYILKWILHDWSDHECIKVLTNIRASMVYHSKLLIIETVVPQTGGSPLEVYMDLNMMVMTGGKQRTEEEWRTLCRRAGLQVISIRGTDSPLSLIEVGRA